MSSVPPALSAPLGRQGKLLLRLFFICAGRHFWVAGLFSLKFWRCEAKEKKKNSGNLSSCFLGLEIPSQSGLFAHILLFPCVFLSVMCRVFTRTLERTDQSKSPPSSEKSHDVPVEILNCSRTWPQVRRFCISY